MSHMGNLETTIQQLIEFLKKRNRVRISEVADFLSMSEKQTGPLINVLEERGVVEIKYPVIGEPEVIMKCNTPDKISISPEQMKEMEESETIVELERTGFKDRMKSEIIREENRTINRKLEKIEEEISDLTKDVSKAAFREKLEEILLIITGIRDVEKISFYLKEVMNLVHKMREKKVWTSEDKDLVVTMLKGIAQSWREYGNEEVAKLFEDLRQKIETV
jgi:hypothetical protein